MIFPSGKQLWLVEFIVLAALWGASFLFARLGAAEFGPLPTAGLRVTVAALFLLPLLLARGLWPELKQHWPRIFLLGMMNSGIPFALYAFAVLSISTGLSSLLNATVPLFGAVVAWAWLKDRPHATKAIGLVIGFIGVVMLAWDKASFKADASGVSSGLAVLACLGACLSYGISASFTKRYMSGRSSLVIAAGSQIGASIGLAVPTVLLWPAQTPGLSAWLAVLAIGVLCTGIAYVLYFRLIDRVGAAASLTVTFLIPVFAVIYGVLFLGESVGWWMLLCALIILCGTALSVGLFNWRRN